MVATGFLLAAPARLRWSDRAGETTIDAAVAPLGWTDEAALAALLSDPERDFLTTLNHPARRARYLAGHALLNRLAGALGDPVRVERAENGQPELTVAGHRLAASISHAGPLVAAALGPVAHLGIDLEFPRARRGWEAIERRYGWPTLAREPDRVRRWSLWEASGKARGLGVFREQDPVFDALAGHEARRADPDDWQVASLPLVDEGWLVLVCDGPPRTPIAVTPGLLD